MSIKVTKSDRSSRAQVSVKTKGGIEGTRGFNWWAARSKGELCSQVLETASFLKQQQDYRYRQASVHARLYGNMPIGIWGSTHLSTTRNHNANLLPIDRPTMNVVQSCIDTLVSRISQSKPKPMFLTDGGDYKQRRLAKELNAFSAGELYQTKAYEHGETVLRHAATLGTGVLKVFETDDCRVGVEPVLATELLVDQNDAFYGMPRSMYQLKLVDRSVLAAMLPSERSMIQKAENAYPDNGADAQKTVADQVMVVEAWHLPSKKGADDGRHVIACTSGLLLDEEWRHDYFPFTFLHYAPRLVGFWAQGLAEQLIGTQVEINKLLSTISKSISLVGVPRVFVEDGSKVVKAHLNADVGSIVTYRGTKPQYEVAPCVPEELYAQLQRLVEYAYQQSGVSALAATSQKPSGLNSGEAIRNYDDLQSDRFATLNKRYDAMYIDLTYKMIDLAKEICERDGKYQSIYPDKDGTQQIDLPAAKMLDNPFVIQCFDSSSLPTQPAGRLQKVTELMQAGMLSPDEGRRLLNFPDLEAEEKLKFAMEERILHILDDIVEKGQSGYEPPDPFMDPAMAIEKVTQYYNLYANAKLEESKLELLRTFKSQALLMQQAAQPPAPAMGAPGAPQPPANAPLAAPEAPPTSPMLPNAPGH